MAAQQAQIATQQAIEANQQAIQNMQQASQQASLDAQQAAANAQQDTGPAVAQTRVPSFSIKAGPVAPGTQVRLKCPTHYAVIYYTTNGWTPTLASRRYTGPITVTRTTEIQAIAVAPNMVHSQVVRANYTLNAPAAPPPPITLTSDGVLRAGTRLHLVTGATLNSKTAQIGDSLKLLLDQDVLLGNDVVLPKGTLVDAKITQADPAGAAGTPGDLSFEIHTLTAGSTHIDLKGGETLEGANRYKSRGLLLIPVVGLAGLAVHGEEAEIKPGMTLTAAVVNDTLLHP